MKKRLVVILFLVFSLPFVFVTQTHAASENPSTILESGKTVQGDYFAANKSIQILGTVNGDVYAAGGSIIINGVINGDVLAAGGNIYIGGIVTGNIRVAGGEITVMGNVAKNATVAGGTITWSPEAKIGGSVLAFTNNASLSGKVGKDARILGNNVTLSQAMVAGDLTYWSARDALITNDSKVNGQTNHITTNAQAKVEQGAEEAGRFFSSVTTIGSFITTLALGLLMIRFLSRYVARGEEILHHEFGKSLLRGMFGMIVIPVAIMLLFITLIGIPLGLMGTIAFVLYLYVARVFAIIALGAVIFRLAKTKGGLTKSLLVGILVYYLLSLIPVLGGLIKTIVLVAALGAAMTNDKRTWAMSKASKLI